MRSNERGIAVMKNTVKVNAKGIARLSSDLLCSKRFTPMPLQKKRLMLIADPKGSVRIYFSSPRAKSGYICIADALNTLEVKGKARVGEFKATLRRGEGVDTVSIDFSAKLKKTG